MNNNVNKGGKKNSSERIKPKSEFHDEESPISSEPEFFIVEFDQEMISELEQNSIPMDDDLKQASIELVKRVFDQLSGNTYSDN